jgi:hypothetical protein
MVEAVRTTASPAAIWAIVVIASVCLVFWLGAVAWADMHPPVRRRQLPEMPGPVLGGVHVAEGGRSVAPTRDAPAVFGEPLPDVPAQRSGAAEPAGTPEPAGRVVPGQRSGETDQPERSAAGSAAADSRDTAG